VFFITKCLLTTEFIRTEFHSILLWNLSYYGPFQLYVALFGQFMTPFSPHVTFGDIVVSKSFPYYSNGPLGVLLKSIKLRIMLVIIKNKETAIILTFVALFNLSFQTFQMSTPRPKKCEHELIQTKEPQVKRS
jgi:hypothetical protein